MKNDILPMTGADDPRLTAYALDELSVAERAVVESWLDQHPEARADVDAVAELGQLLSAELAADVGPGLDSARTAVIERQLAESAAPPTAGMVRTLRPWMAAAAVLLVSAVAVQQLLVQWDVRAPAESETTARRDAARPVPSGADALLGKQADGAALPRDAGDDAASGVSNMPATGAEGVVAHAEELAESVDSEFVASPEVQERLLQFGYLGLDESGASESVVQTSGGGSATAGRPGAAYQGSSLADPPGTVAPPPNPVASSEPAPGTPASTPVKMSTAARGASASAAPDKAGVAGGASRSGSGGGSGGQYALTGRGRAAVGGKAKDGGLGAVVVSGDEVSLRIAGPVASGEGYADLPENPFVIIGSDPHSALSTFGLDVDTASYSNVRRFLNRSQAPPPNAVRIEELVNAFHYDDPQPEGDDPLAVSVEAAACPWAEGHRLVRIGLAGRRIAAEARPPSNLVFLVDVSGSMQSDDKLPLLVQSLELLLPGLRDDDRVAIVTYASGTSVVLPSTPCSERKQIVAALRSLSASGSTHASEGIELAYQVATEAFLPEGNNRVLLATDGDFNVGITDQGGLTELIRTQAQGGVFLTVLGFGSGNLKDDTAELLADRGNGNYAYIDSLDEAHRVLVKELLGTLHTIARDVKLQVEFNPGRVAAYRLLGYENRALAATDFRDDKKDAGEVGAGHSLTVLYEVVPVGLTALGGTADLRYQEPAPDREPSGSPELLNVNLRWAPPVGGVARELARPLVDTGHGFEEASTDLRFAAAVASFGMLLRGSAHAGSFDLATVADLAEAARGVDADGRRAEFVRLARTARGVLNDR